MLAIAHTIDKQGFSEREPYILEVTDTEEAIREIRSFLKSGETAFAFDYPGAGREVVGSVTWEYAEKNRIAI